MRAEPAAIQVSRWHSVWPRERHTPTWRGTILETWSRIHYSEQGRLPHARSKNIEELNNENGNQIVEIIGPIDLHLTAWRTFGPHCIVCCPPLYHSPREWRHSEKWRRWCRYTTTALSCCVNPSNNMQIADITCTTTLSAGENERSEDE